MGSTVIIFGLGPSSAQCPFDAETWVVNMGYWRVYKMKGRIDKLFTAHTPCKYPTLLGATRPLQIQDATMDWGLIDQLIDFGLEVISLHRIQGLRSKIFPLKRIIKKFGCDYFTDSMCYMIAYAIDKGYKKIKLYGVDMYDRDEFQFEKGGIEYWIGFARGQGIEVIISNGSYLCRNATGLPYGVLPKPEKSSDFMEEELVRLTGGELPVSKDAIQYCTKGGKPIGFRREN